MNGTSALMGRRIETEKGDQLFRRTFARGNGAETMQEDKEREGAVGANARNGTEQALFVIQMGMTLEKGLDVLLKLV